MPVGALLAALAALAPMPAGAQQGPDGGTDQGVASAQARADQAANAYLNALIRLQQLDGQVAELEQQIGTLEQQVGELRDQARSRAVEAYKRSSSSVGVQLGGDVDEMDSARRTVLIDLVNARDNDAAARLRTARDDLDVYRQELKTTQQAQADLVSRLKAEEEQLNADLATAQNERRRAAGATTDGGLSPVGNYVATAGEHPQHNHPFLVCTRRIESSGNYRAYNPSGPYYGAYQFLQSTWNSTANHAGRGDLVGVDPRDASEYDQDDMAWTLYQWKGKGPWNGRC